MKKMLLMLCFAISVVVCPAIASGPEGIDEEHGPFAGLRLSEEQKSKWQALRESHRAEMKTKRAELKKAKEAFEAMRYTNVSDTELRAAFDKQLSLKASVAKSSFEHLLAMRALLTEEQRKAFVQAEKRRNQE